MKPEEKQLLLKDLCARLPFGVKFPYHIEEDSNHHECECIATINAISEDTIEFTYNENGRLRDWSCAVAEVKPYLRPMSSMTEEERMELKADTCPNGTGYFDEKHLICPINHYGENISYRFMSDILEWLNAHHFDYLGLIPKGLALESPADMYKQIKQ